MPDQRRYVAINPEDHSLSVEREAIPSPSPGELLIKVSAAGLNRADLLQRRGLYPPPPDASPVMGLEVAGEVIAVGSDAGAWQPGDRVCALLAGGGYAERVTADAGSVFPIPEGMDAEYVKTNGGWYTVETHNTLVSEIGVDERRRARRAAGCPPQPFQAGPRRHGPDHRRRPCSHRRSYRPGPPHCAAQPRRRRRAFQRLLPRQGQHRRNRKRDPVFRPVRRTAGVPRC